MEGSGNGLLTVPILLTYRTARNELVYFAAEVRSYVNLLVAQ